MNFLYLFLRRQIRAEFKRLKSRNKGLFKAVLRYSIKIKELRKRNEYLQRLNACYAADRQKIMAEPGGPDQAARKFPRVTAFLNGDKGGKGK